MTSFSAITRAPTPLANGFPLFIAEYVPDQRYMGSHYRALLVGYVDKSASSYQSCHEVLNSEVATTLTFSKTVGYTFGSFWSTAQHLLRYTDDDVVKYTPALVVATGEDIPEIYTQRTGTGAFESLDAIDGGDGTVTYLTAPPVGKYLEVFKERLFIANTADAGNRIHHTGPDSALAMVCNVWPASYNIDVGDSSPITGIRAWGDYLVIFKESSIYTITGDGVGGNWQIDLADTQHGAVSNSGIVATSAGLMFIANDGVYLWSGGTAKNISHPYFQDTWNSYSVAPSADFVPYAAYDPKRHLVLFGVSAGTTVNTPLTSTDITALVYDLKRNAWSRWGSWGGAPSDHGLVPMLDSFFQLAATTSDYGGWGPTLVGIRAIVSTQMNLCVGGSTYSIPWFIQTNKYFKDDFYEKLLRYVVLWTKDSGDWDLATLTLRDDEYKTAALKRNASASNIIVDAANAAEHVIDGTSSFQTAASGPVDVYHIPFLYKEFDSRTLVASTGADKIKFSAALSSTSRAGELLILPEDTETQELTSMLDADSVVYGGSGVTYGNVRFAGEQFSKKIIPDNLQGKEFSLWMSNVGSYQSGTNYAKPGMLFELRGFGLMARQLGILGP
jgi:hypothetical protein